MDISTRKLLKAVSKKRGREGPSEDRRAPVPKRPTARVSRSPVPTEPPAILEVDLTADTPPEGAMTEGIQRERTAPEGSGARKVPAVEGPVATEELPALSGATLPGASRGWGEGPSGTANSPLEQTPANSPRAGSENAEGVEGRGTEPRPPRGSVLDDGHWAEEVLSSTFRPEILEELSRLKTGSFFRESYAAVLRIANSFRAAREVIRGGKALLREAQKEADEASARAAAAEGALEAARTARADEIGAAISRAEIAASRLREALSQMTIAQDAAAARDLHISELSLAVEEAKGQAAEAKKRAEVAEESSRAAEGRMKAAEEKARAAEERADRAKEEANLAREAERAAAAALVAERGVQAVEMEAAVAARSAGVIAEYRASERFTDDLAEVSTSVFLKGFQHGKEKIARELNLPQALEIEPDDPTESTPSDDGSAPDEP